TIRMRKGRHICVEVEDPETSSGLQDSDQLGYGSVPPRDMGERSHTHHGVEQPVGERQAQRIAFAKLYAITKVCFLRKLTGHGQEGGTWIESDGQAAGADAPGDFASDGPLPQPTSRTRSPATMLSKSR